MFLTFGLVLLSTEVTGHASQQEALFSVEDSVKAAPEDASFLAAYGVELNGSWVVEFFRGADDRDRLIAVRSLSTPYGRQNSQQVNNENCPEIRDVVAALSDLPSSDIRISGFSPWSNLRLPPGPESSGANYRVWGNARQADGAFANLSVSANSGLLADAVQKMEEHLDRCWSSDGPPAE